MKEQLLARMQGINDWIRNNPQICNANMYEITSCALDRNDYKALDSTDDLDAELNTMVALRKESIDDFLEEVPECKKLYEAVINGDDSTQMLQANQKEVVKKSLSVPFFVYNTRKYGMSGDIKNSDNPMPSFNHDNYNEVQEMVENYSELSDDLKELVAPAINWTLQNSVPAIKNSFTIEAVNVKSNSL